MNEPHLSTARGPAAVRGHYGASVVALTAATAALG